MNDGNATLSFLLFLKFRTDRMNMVCCKKYFPSYSMFHYNYVFRDFSSYLASIIARTVVDKILSACLENVLQPSTHCGIETDEHSTGML